uniref:Uncharacterized protein n=1 Tax=Anopheles atroparvus TaxID=41427 RepID=A0A182JAQ5_ANOAO
MAATVKAGCTNGTTMPDFVKLNDSDYCVDFVCVPGEPDSLKCILFDMSSLWLQQLPLAAVVERENKRNPICNYTEALIRSTLLAEKAASYTLDPTSHKENPRTLTIKYYIADTPVTFEFTLKPATAEELSECVILPLWRTVLLLDAKNRALAEQLAQKDIEIEQYRAEGAELKRTTVQTAKFDHQAFDENFPVRLPPANGLDVHRILEGHAQRENLTKALQMVVLPSVGRTSGNPSSSGKAIKRSPTSKFPNLPDNPLNSSLSMAERFRMRESDDDD